MRKLIRLMNITSNAANIYEYEIARINTFQENKYNIRVSVLPVR